jgi:hypothetical protein
MDGSLPSAEVAMQISGCQFKPYGDFGQGLVSRGMQADRAPAVERSFI